MDMSFKLYILSSNGPEVYAVNICKDDKNKDGYVILGNTNVSLHLLEVLHLRDHVCSIKGVGDFDKNNLKLWKLEGFMLKDFKKQNISTEEDIIQKLHGEEMELVVLFSTYFQYELDNKNKSGSSIITIIPATGKCLPTFYLSNKKFAVTKYRVWSDLFFFISNANFVLSPSFLLLIVIKHCPKKYIFTLS